MNIITTTTITTSSCGGAANLPLTNCSNTLFQFNMNELITTSIIIKNVHDVIFDGMGNTFTCNISGSNKTFFVIYENCKNIEIRNFKAYALINGCDFERLRIHNSNVKREYIFIHDNELHNFSIAISLGAENISPNIPNGQGVNYSEVYNNKIFGTNGTESGTGYGIHLANARYCKVYNNYILHTTRHAIYHAWGQNNEITGNIIVEHWKGVGIYDSSAEALAAGSPSAVRGNVRSAIAVFRDSQNVTIKENRFFDVYNVCIHVYPSPEPTNYNWISYADQSGIKIKDNHFYNTRFHQEDDGSISGTYPSIMVGFVKDDSVLYENFNHPMDVEITGNKFLYIDTNSLMSIRVYEMGRQSTNGQLIINNNRFVFSSEYRQGHEENQVIVQVDKKYRTSVHMNAEIANNTFIALNELSGLNIGALFNLAFYFNQNVTISISANQFLNQRMGNVLAYRAYFGFDPYTYNGSQTNISYQPESIETVDNPSTGYHLHGDIIFNDLGATYNRYKYTQSGAPGTCIPY